MEQREEKVPETAAQVARKRLEKYLDETLANQRDEVAWDFCTRLWIKAQDIPLNQSDLLPGFLAWGYQEDCKEARENRKYTKRTYWKVEVEAYDYGAVLAAITGSEERETPPEEVRQFERHGMTVTELWFDDKDKAEAFVANIRRPGN